MTKTQIILLLVRLDDLPQVILPADPAFVQMTLDTFGMHWEIIQKDRYYTVVRNLQT